MSKNIENATHAIYKDGKWYVSRGSTGGGNVVAISASESETIDLSKYPIGTLFVLYEEE